MKPISSFTQSLTSNPEEFWASVKYIGDHLGYATKKTKKNPNTTILVHSTDAIISALQAARIPTTKALVQELHSYFKIRKTHLEMASRHLMNLKQAHTMFSLLKSDPLLKGAIKEYNVPFPMNKQKKEKRAPAYYTCIINMLTAYAFTTKNTISKIDWDPHHLATYSDKHGNLLFTSSRRFDGAIPSLYNPRIIWEIKEYYYTTSFGSRVADGVYETQLDGFELNQLKEKHGINIHHVFLIDAYDTWWGKGKSYLCRIFDALNQGAVDEVLFGDEVLSEWPRIINHYI